jgi:HSP20 family molecular chaperone IbpA
MVMNRWNPWTDLLSMHDQLLFNEGLGHGVSERTTHTLPIDIRQSDEAFEIEASVPGFKPEDIEITFDENVLTIRGFHLGTRPCGALTSGASATSTRSTGRLASRLRSRLTKSRQPSRTGSSS